MATETGDRSKRNAEVAALPSIPHVENSPSQPLQIPRADLPKLTDIKKKLAEQKPYWCGSMPNPSFQNFNFGGREFVAHQEDVQNDEDGQTRRFRRAGKIHWLTDAQVKAILLDITNKVMRGRGPGAKVQPVLHADYKPHDADHPAGEYVYFVAVSSEFQPPPYEKNKVPRGAVPVVRPIPQEAVA